jgi:hypothetical protein
VSTASPGPTGPLRRETYQGALTPGVHWTFDSVASVFEPGASRQVEGWLAEHPQVVRSAVIWNDHTPIVFIEPTPEYDQWTLRAYCRQLSPDYGGTDWLPPHPRIVFGPLPTDADGLVDRRRLSHDL